MNQATLVIQTLNLRERLFDRINVINLKRHGENKVFYVDNIELQGR